jgi:hypothetical protein
MTFRSSRAAVPAKFLALAQSLAAYALVPRPKVRLLASILTLFALALVADLRHMPQRQSALVLHGVALALIAGLLAVAVSVPRSQQSGIISSRPSGSYGIVCRDFFL